MCEKPSPFVDIESLELVWSSIKLKQCQIFLPNTSVPARKRKQNINNVFGNYTALKKKEVGSSPITSCKQSSCLSTGGSCRNAARGPELTSSCPGSPSSSPARLWAWTISAAAASPAGWTTTRSASRGTGKWERFMSEKFRISLFVLKP